MVVFEKETDNKGITIVVCDTRHRGLLWDACALPTLAPLLQLQRRSPLPLMDDRL